MTGRFYRGDIPDAPLEPPAPRYLYLCPGCGQPMTEGDVVYRMGGAIIGCGRCVEQGYLEENDTEDDTEYESRWS